MEVHGPMERLSGLDASFLYLETRSQLMHVVGVIEIDPSTMPGGYSFHAMRDELSRRISAMPNFRRKLDNSLLNIDHPVWVEDADFDIEKHVRRVGVPAPGGERELTELIGHIAGRELHRSKPLWEMWVIEGMANGNVAVVLRMHHANVDGVTSAEMLSQLCTITPEPPQLDADKIKETAGGTSRLTMAVGGALNFVQRPLALARLLPGTVKVPIGWAKRAMEGSAMPLPFQAPGTPFNAPITPHRSLALTQLPLDDVKRVKDRYGAKINDVVLAIAAGALRSYLQNHGGLPDRPLVAMVPVSVHGSDETALVETGTNKVSGMFTQLATDVDDPVERVERAAELARRSKDHHADIDANILRAWAQFAPGEILQQLMKSYGGRKLSALHPPVFNVVVSNVPGPPLPLYYLGARVVGVYPLGPIFHGLGLNISVFSVDKSINVGLLGCTELVPDIDKLAHSFEDELAKLVDTCD